VRPWSAAMQMQAQAAMAAMSSASIGGGGAFGRGLHSLTFQLNVSAFCGIGVAFKVCSGAVRGH